MNRTEHTNPRGANGPTHICDSFFGKPARLFFCLNRQVRMSYDSSILGLDCSRFMIHESGSMFDLILARLVHSTRPRQQFTPRRVRDDGDDGPCGPRYRLRRLCFCHVMRRWMETRVVLHRRRERSDGRSLYGHWRTRGAPTGLLKYPTLFRINPTSCDAFWPGLSRSFGGRVMIRQSWDPAVHGS